MGFDAARLAAWQVHNDTLAFYPCLEVGGGRGNGKKPGRPSPCAVQAAARTAAVLYHGSYSPSASSSTSSPAASMSS